MQRRTVLKNLFFVAGGALVLPACLTNKEETSIPLRRLKIDGSQEKLLAEISETIIPATATPGAKDTYAHVFALKVVDDCMEKDVQEKFVKGLDEVNAMAKKRFNKSFINSSPAQRQSIISDLETKKVTGENIDAFYTNIKSLTVQGFLQSKYVMTSVHPYELVPGRYNGFAPVKTVHHSI